MYVRPEDIANLCAIYSELGVRRISSVQLEGYLQRSMPIDSYSCPTLVVVDAIDSGLIERSGDVCVLTDKGRGVAARQKQTSSQISDQARKFLLTKVYLDLNNRGAECARLLCRFQIDTVLKTFVFQRSEQDTPEDTWWLKTLGRLGFLTVDTHIARIFPHCLPLANELLRQVREGTFSDSTVGHPERRQIGDFAEKRAVQHEIDRLSRLRHDELCPLVQRISLVDTSAGYDVTSFRGTGRHPDERIYIEVKGTKNNEAEFIWSRNERRVASLKRKSYWIYVYTRVDIRTGKSCGPIRINDPIRTLEARGYVQEPVDVRVSKGAPVA